MMKKMNSSDLCDGVSSHPGFLDHAHMLVVRTHLVSNCFELLISSRAVGFDFLLRAVGILCYEIMHLCRVTLRLDFSLFLGACVLSLFSGVRFRF